MNHRPEQFFGQAVAWMVARSVVRFRFLYTTALVILGLFALGAVAFSDWLPRCLAWLLVVLFMLALLSRKIIYRAFEKEQVEIWQRFDDLVQPVKKKATAALAYRGKEHPQSQVGPLFLVTWPDDELPQEEETW